jgi:branched-chain amino acid transport system ATP-binding protein
LKLIWGRSAILELQEIAAGYGEADTIKNISIQVQDKRVTTIIGPNGSGKSTVLKTIYGFLTPRKGTVTLNGKVINSVKPHEMLAMGLAYIPQERSIFPYLTVEKNLLLGAWTLRRQKNEVKRRLNEVYEEFPVLKANRNRVAGNLSGGEQQMIEIGRAFVPSPHTVLIDEPTAGLAPKPAARIYSELHRIKMGGTTILLVDQNVREAVKLADYVCVMELGELSAFGTRQRFEEDLSGMVKGWLKLP